MAFPVYCNKCLVSNSILSSVCRSCGSPISSNIGRISNSGQRVPAADWRTVDLHKKWEQDLPGEFIEADGDVHLFLDYCKVLRDLSKGFSSLDQSVWLDGIVFFLRGGYSFFAYLNETTDLALRGTIFGGLNHARFPKKQWRKWLCEVRDAGIRYRTPVVDICFIDEAKSGTGIGTLLNIATAEFYTWKMKCPVFNFHLFAVRRGMNGETASNKFVETCEKWRGNGRAKSVHYSVTIREYVGFLLGYDDDLLSGVRKLSHSIDPYEEYELVNRRNGNLTLKCPTTSNPVFASAIGNNALVAFLNRLAVDISYHQQRATVFALSKGIIMSGCSECRARLAELSPTLGLPQMPLRI